MAVDVSPPERTVVRGACPHDCPDTLRDARNRRRRPRHPRFRAIRTTRSRAGSSARRSIATSSAPTIATGSPPRSGAWDQKERGQFERATWDEALDAIAARLNDDRAFAATDRRRSCPIRTPARWDWCRARRWTGGSSTSSARRMLDRTICSMAGTVGMRMTVGANVGADGEGIPQSDLVLLWGTNTLTANPHLWPFVLEGARERRADHRDRSDPHAHRRPVRRVDRHPSRAPTPRSRSG